MTTWLWIAFGAVALEAVVILCLWRARNYWRRSKRWADVCRRNEEKWFDETHARLLEYEPHPVFVDKSDDDVIETDVIQADGGCEITVTYGPCRVICGTDKRGRFYTRWERQQQHVIKPKTPPTAAKVGTIFWRYSRPQSMWSKYFLALEDAANSALKQRGIDRRVWEPGSGSPQYPDLD